MANLHIENVLCHGDVEIEFAPGVTAVTGEHSAGKSSIALILGALAAHQPNPMRVNATSLSVYVKAGKIEGMAALDEVIWKPIEGMALPDGAAPTASPHAAGLVEFVRKRISAKERARLWEELFIPPDPKEILGPLWKRDKRQLEAVIGVIQSNGGDWDAALKIYEGQRQAAKQRWQKETGEPRYGAAKAASWVPENWHTELASKSEADLTAEITNATDELQLITSQQAISQDRIHAAITVRDVDIPKIKEEIDAVKAEVDKTKGATNELAVRVKVEESQVKQLRERERELKQLLPEAPHQCPECGTGLSIYNGQLIKWDERPEVSQEHRDELESLSTNLEAALKSAARVRKGYANAMEAVAGKEATLNGLLGKLELMETQAEDADKEAVEINEDDVARRQTQLEDAKANKRAWKKWRAALKEHDEVVELDTICGLLGPNGARASLMGQHMDKVRTILKNITNVTGWREIKIGRDYAITSGGRPIDLTAHNEKMKAQYAMQIAVAMLTGSEWLILDAVDILHGDSWQGLVSLMDRLATKRPNLHIVLCGMEINEPSWTTIDLSAHA